jgi:hypothetical protein
MVTDVTYERIENGDVVWKVYTVPSETYRPGMSEVEAARLATRVVDYASAPSARGVERVLDN